MQKVRRQKLESLLKREISGIVVRGIKDPRVKMVTVNAVSMTNDMKIAHVYVGIMGTKAEQQKCFKGLVSAAGFIKKEIGEYLRIRFIPDVKFKLDEGQEKRDRVIGLLKTIEEQSEND